MNVPSVCLRYMAPEILDNKNYSALCDVWALGIIMYYLSVTSALRCRCGSSMIRCRISGRHPYVASDERRLLTSIRSQKLRYDSEAFLKLSSEGLFLHLRTVALKPIDR